MLEELKHGVQEKLNNILDLTKVNFNTLLVSGAHPSLLNRVQVQYFEEMMPIQNLANIKTIDSETLVIVPFDLDSVHKIAKAISMSHLQVNPIIDGHHIKLIIPKMSEERRKEFVKKAKAFLEEAKIKVRNIRKEGITKIKNNKELSENEIDLYQKELQKLFDEVNKQLDILYKEKEKTLLQV